MTPVKMIGVMASDSEAISARHHVGAIHESPLPARKVPPALALNPGLAMTANPLCSNSSANAYLTFMLDYS